MTLVQTEATSLLAALTKGTAYTAPTAPIMGRLMTANGSATAAGTEVANAGGSSYAAQSVSGARGTPAAGSVTNTSPITYTNMPAATVVGLEEWDSAGTPRRLQFGALTASKTTQLGDSLAFAASAWTSTLV